jgi:solute carrier family 7 (L-type amino acid transporter), member 9/15
VLDQTGIDPFHVQYIGLFRSFWASPWPCGSLSAGLFAILDPQLFVIIVISAVDAYNFILDVECYDGTIISVFVVFGLFILLWRAPNIPRPFKVWLPVAIYFLVAQCLLLVDPFLRPPGGKGETSLPY